METKDQIYHFEKSLKLQKKIHKLIPGGAHTYAKGDDQYPEFMPPIIAKGKGCRVWDLDGNSYIEYNMGIRSVTLGHAFEPIIKAAYKQMKNGINFVRPSKIEIEYAEEFLGVLEGAEMVKFGKNGSDAVNGAVRLARAYTGREKIAICADHPFFSVDDWFISTTPMSSGIPEYFNEITLTFNYNDLASVEKMFAQNPGQIACVILEPEKYTPPTDNFLQKLKDVCHKNGAVFVLDEMITGFRAHLGGAQSKYNVVPDLSTFGKAMANGFSISALAGRKELMELGGLHHEKEKVFLLSLTHGGETHALAAAKATLDFYKKYSVIEKLYERGSKIKKGLNKVSEELQLSDFFKVIGPDYCSVYTTLDNDKNPSQEFRTLFLQETLKRGLLMPSTMVSYSHKDADINETIEKIYDVLVVYKKALNEGINKYLVGRSVKPAIRKYN